MPSECWQFSKRAAKRCGHRHSSTGAQSDEMTRGARAQSVCKLHSQAEFGYYISGTRGRLSLDADELSNICSAARPARILVCAPWSVRRPLLTLRVNPGSRHRCGKSD